MLEIFIKGVVPPIENNRNQSSLDTNEENIETDSNKNVTDNSQWETTNDQSVHS